MACWRPVSRPANVAGCSRAPSCPRLPSFPHHPVATLTTGRSEIMHRKLTVGSSGLLGAEAPVHSAALVATPKIAAVATSAPSHRFDQTTLLHLAGYCDARRTGFVANSHVGWGPLH